MTDQEKIDAHEAAIESLRNYVTSLRAEKQRSEDRIDEIVTEQRVLDERADAIDAELAQAERSLKALALTRAPQLSSEPQKPKRQQRKALPMEAARDAMQQLGEFTISELAAVLEIDVQTARRVTRRALEPFGQDERPTVEKTEKTKRPEGGWGKSAAVYAFVKPEANGHAPHSRPRSAPEVELRRIGAQPAPSGRKMKVRKDTAEMVAEARRLGYHVERLKNNHLRVTDAQGNYVDTIASSRSEYRGGKNARANMRRHARAA